MVHTLRAELSKAIIVLSIEQKRVPSTTSTSTSVHHLPARLQPPTPYVRSRGEAYVQSQGIHHWMTLSHSIRQDQQQGSWTCSASALAGSVQCVIIQERQGEENTCGEDDGVEPISDAEAAYPKFAEVSRIAEGCCSLLV